METLDQQFKQELKKMEESIQIMKVMLDEHGTLFEGPEVQIIEKISQMIDSLNSININWKGWESSAGSCGWLNEGETAPAWDSSIC